MQLAGLLNRYGLTSDLPGKARATACRIRWRPKGREPPMPGVGRHGAVILAVLDWTILGSCYPFRWTKRPNRLAARLATPQHNQTTSWPKDLMSLSARALPTALLFSVLVSITPVGTAHSAELSPEDIAFLGQQVAFPQINASLSFEFGASDYRQGEPSAAERVRQDAALRDGGAADPTNPQALLEVGDSWSRIGEDIIASRWYRRALEGAAKRLSQSGNVPPLEDGIAYGESMLRLGQTSTAVGVFAALVDLYPKAADPKYHLSTALLARGNLSIAQQVAGDLIAQHDDSLDAQALWGSLQFALAVSRNAPDPLADRMDLSPIRAALRRYPDLDPAMRWLEWNLRIAAHTLQRIAERKDQSQPWSGIAATDAIAEELAGIRANLTTWSGAPDAPAAVWKAISWLDFLEGRAEPFFQSALQLLTRTYDQAEYEFCILALRMLDRSDLGIRLLILKSAEYPHRKYRHMLAYLYDEAGEQAQAAATLRAAVSGDTFADIALGVLALRAGDAVTAKASFGRGLEAGYAANDADYYRGLKALLEGDRSTAEQYFTALRPKASPSQHPDRMLEHFGGERAGQ